MKDFLCKEVQVGDYIFYSTTSRYAESRLCQVTRFTEKSIFGKIVKTNRRDMLKDKEVVIKNDFVKVDFKIGG